MTQSPRPPTTELPAERGPLHVKPEQLPSASPEVGPASQSTNAPPLEPGPSWQEELSERLEKSRLRRARLRGGSDPNASLDFDFERADEQGPKPAVGGKVIGFPQATGKLDLHIGPPPGSGSAAPVLDSLSLEKTAGGARVLNSAAVEAGELSLEHPSVAPGPVEIVLESSQKSDRLNGSDSVPAALPMAPLELRFYAGVVDALVLLLAGSLFWLIFWWAGGRISPQPANLAVLALIGVFLILVYFGLFTALTSSTPGLLSMGLEVRNLDGSTPTVRDSLWRAFGYLVSIASLMLGFIWALVDSDSLTWHDRMSGTFLTIASNRPNRLP